MTAQDLLATKKRIKELETQSGQIDGYRTLGRQIGATRAQLNQAQRDAQQMAQQFAKVEQPTKAMTRAMEQAKQKVRDLSQQEREMVARHGSLKRAMNEAGINTKQLGITSAASRLTWQPPTASSTSNAPSWANWLTSKSASTRSKPTTARPKNCAANSRPWRHRYRSRYRHRHAGLQRYQRIFQL